MATHPTTNRYEMMQNIYESVKPDSVVLNLNETEVEIAQNIPEDQKHIITNKDYNFKEQVVD